MMAEAAVERPNTKYYCHKCSQEIDPVIPEYICPRCESGFIEELVQEPPNNSSEESEDDDLTEIPHPGSGRDVFHIIDFLQRVALEQRQGNGNQDEDMETPGTSSGGPSFSSVSPMLPFSQRRRCIFRRPRRRTRQERIEMFRRPAEGFFNLQQLITTLLERRDNTGVPFPGFLNLHSSPADYAWGTGGLDAIITQLLNQFDGMGAPPLAREKIDEIPIMYITKDDVDKTLQCTVCMEDYKLGEPVKQLSCEHVFHNECIVPWLELHGTCPICRKSLNDESQNSSNRSNIDNMTQGNASNRNNSSNTESSSMHQTTLCDFIDEDFD